MSVLDLIAAERARQIALGFNRFHDGSHTLGELSRAALARLLVADYRGEVIGLCDCDLLVKLISPFDNGSPLLRQSRQRLLVEAGALIVAELERLLPDSAGPALGKRPSAAVFAAIGDFSRATAGIGQIADPVQRLKVLELLADFVALLWSQITTELAQLPNTPSAEGAPS